MVGKTCQNDPDSRAEREQAVGKPVNFVDWKEAQYSAARLEDMPQKICKFFLYFIARCRRNFFRM